MTREKAYALRAMIVKAAASLSDEDALSAVELFEAYQIDRAYETGDRFRYNGKLYRVRQAHTSAAQWKPDEAPSLYEHIAEPGDGGTPDKPIAYNNNMALENGKYYSQNGVIYRCIRDSGIPIYADLSALVGNYVEVYDG